MKIIQSYKFKLLPTKNQEKFLNDYFYRFAKTVNFAVKKIPKVENIQKEKFEFIREGIKGKCSYCGKTYKICRQHKPEGKNRRDRNKICKSCNQNALLNRKNKSKKEFVCQKCWNKEFSIRKILYATRGRKRSLFGDIKDSAKLPGTEYNLAFKRAADTLKAHKQQLKRIQRNIKFKENKLEEWKEVIDNKEIDLKQLKRWYKVEILEKLKTDYGFKVSAKFILPHQPNQRVDRYKHIIYRDNPSKGKTESQIKKTIEALEKTIKKLNKQLEEARIRFKGTIVDLQNTSVKNINERDIELSIDGRKEKFAIAVANIKSEKSKKWFLDIISRIKEEKPRYPLLFKKNSSFFLSYPVAYDIEDIEIDLNKSKIMGIDRGVNQIAVTAVINSKNATPHHIKFYSGRGLMKEKIKYQLIRKKFTGTKSVNKRRAKFGKKVARISEYILHNISREIVNQAKELKPIIIVMENLKITPGEKRIKRMSALKERKINFMLSNFTYSKLQRFIEYKAASSGISVKFINPEYTSQLCYICHKPGDRIKGFFKCLNPECGHKMNADLNAAVNIANSLYKEFKG